MQVVVKMGWMSVVNETVAGTNPFAEATICEHGRSVRIVHDEGPLAVAVYQTVTASASPGASA
jgi:hypothetical protein